MIQEHEIYCEKCKGRMDLYEDKNGFYYECENCPDCDNWIPATTSGDPIKIPMCPECGSYLILRTGKFGNFYGCEGFPQCDVTLTCNSEGVPNGTPATTEDREGRKRVARLSKILIDKGRMERWELSTIIVQRFNVELDKATLAYMSADQCQVLADILLERGA